MKTTRYHYLGFLLLLLLFGCDRAAVSPRVLVIHSFRDDEKFYPELDASIQRELLKKDIHGDLRTFYLDCEAYRSEEEEERMYHFIDSIQDWKPDIILVNDDQATYTLMKCGHPFVKTLPVVFSGVNYPNWELMKAYPNVTGSWDKCDYQANLGFIENEFGTLRIYVNYDRTVLGQLAFHDFVDCINQDKFVLDFNSLVGFTGNERLGFNPSLDRFERESSGERPQKSLIKFMPFREAQGNFLLMQVSGILPYRAFLNIRYDHTSNGLAKLFNIPCFTTVREIFGIGMGVLGGYFCSNDMQAKVQAEIAAEILKEGKAPADIQVTESPKEYLYDWEVMKRLGIHFKEIPDYIHISNLPYYVRYQNELLILSVVFLFLVICVIGYLTYLYNREAGRRKRVLVNLEQETARLTVALGRAEESDRMKSAFLANMSHEIRTPLNAIVGFSNLMNSEVGLEPEEKEQFTKLINTNSDLLLKLINDILDLSRIESGKMDFVFDHFDLNEVVDEIYRTHQLMMPPCVELRKRVPDVPATVFVDQFRLKQVLTNFINNAVKFTESGYIEVGYCPDEQGGGLLIYVEDTGKGIPEEKQQQIFERFCKLDEFAQGTGLGLAICQVIALRFGGEIRLTSVVGKGSRFALTLPRERIE